MLPERVLSGLAVAAVLLITVGYFTAHNPEDAYVASGDGVLTVTGLARQTQPLQVTQARAVQAPLLGFTYQLEPEGVVLDEPAVVSFAVSDIESSMVENLQVFRFHPSLEMWESVTPVVAHTNEVLAVETSTLGEFAVGTMPHFEPPVFANVYDQLRAEAPADAVGYEIAVGVTTADEETLRLLSVGESGGCGGAVRVGDGELLSRLERKASVAMGNNDVTMTFVFVTRWFTSTAGGCKKDELLRPVVEYDILDAIQT